MSSSTDDYNMTDFTTVQYAFYDAATGALKQFGSMARSMVQVMSDDRGWPFILGAADAEKYVDLDTLEIVPKQPFPSIASGAHLTNLPVPCTVRIRPRSFIAADTVVEVDDGELELEFTQPGNYQAIVESVQFETGIVEINHETTG